MPAPRVCRPRRHSVSRPTVAKCIRDFTQRLIHLPHVTLVETEVNAYEMALQTMERALLLPRDAYHWALMQTHGLSAIATTDADFTRISESTIYTCNESILAQHSR